ncbi:MAG: Flp pilus assembly complex ATPase component TadA [Veillonellaceae bacterium]|nr:Flp pilus assembly complex ATPase component TadA [Veillonellaceae bacterium]
MKNVLIAARNCGASDVHVTPGETVRLRRAGRLTDTESHVSAGMWENWWRLHAPADAVARLEATGNAEFVVQDESGRVRVSLYRVGGKILGALRLLPAPETLPPEPEPEFIASVAALRDGLVLIGGTTGSGKTTTLLRILQYMNEHTARHIITLEDPPEMLLHSCRSCIRQRTVGSDTPSFQAGLLAALREDPDVIVLGELRTAETLASALLAAETGHLVLATVHGNTLTGLIGRIVHAFPEAAQEEVRYQLAQVVRLLAVQRWVETERERVLLRSYVRWSPAFATLVRDGKEIQLRSYLQTAGDGARSFAKAAQLAAARTTDTELVRALRAVTDE